MSTPIPFKIRSDRLAEWYRTHLDKLPPAARVYLTPRVLLILLLGFSAGLPLSLSGSTLTIWMADRGVDLRAIGLYALVGLPYTIKFLWAPVVDAWRVPLLSRLLGRRRGWLLFSQLLLMAAILFLGGLDPLQAPYMVALGAMIVAAASATQDIVIDAFRVESLKANEQAAGMAYYVSAYRVAMLVSTAGVIAFVALMEAKGVAQSVVWFYGYGAAAALLLVGMVAVLLAREPDAPETQALESKGQTHAGNPLVRLFHTAFSAFADFLQKPHVAAILLFVVLFKFCDSLAGVMTGPFVLDIGFDKASYAAIVKGVGLIAALAGGFVGGMLARTTGLTTSLWISGLLQMFSNLVFTWQAWIGPEHWALVVTILTENFTGSIGTVVFVAYLSALCGNALHTATQFALLSALAAVGRTMLSSTSGFIAQGFGWPLFFILTALAALPGLALLAYLARRDHFAQIVTHHDQALEQDSETSTP